MNFLQKLKERNGTNSAVALIASIFIGLISVFVMAFESFFTGVGLFVIAISFCLVSWILSIEYQLKKIKEMKK